MSDRTEMQNPVAGEEDNLLLLPCERCEEPRYHLCEVVATYFINH